jgi:hypothetical protein
MPKVGFIIYSEWTAIGKDHNAGTGQMLSYKQTITRCGMAKQSQF